MPIFPPLSSTFNRLKLSQICAPIDPDAATFGINKNQKLASPASGIPRAGFTSFWIGKIMKNAASLAALQQARAQFEAYRLDTKVDLKDGPVTLKISVDTEQLSGDFRVRELQPYSLGSFVAVVSSGVCSHVGLVSSSSDGKRMPSCEVTVWPLDEGVELPRQTVQKIGGLSGVLQGPLVKCIAAGSEFKCRLRCLGLVDANELRSQIGMVVPEAIRKIFWSDFEIALIDANQRAQEQYTDRATELLETL